MGKASKNQFLNIGGLEDMREIKKYILDKLPRETLLLVLLIITLLGMSSILYNKESTVSELYGALDAGSAVALAVLAFWGYYKYIQSLKKEDEYIAYIRDINNRETEGSEIALLIQFGGKGNMIGSMKGFLSNIDFQGTIKEAPSFGDIKNNINREDIKRLKTYCEDVRAGIALASKVHIFYGGIGVGYAVVADILSNTTDILFYHKDNNSYEVWYEDAKSNRRIKDKIEPKH